MASTAGVEAGRAYVLVQSRDGLSPGFSAIRNRLRAFSIETAKFGQATARVGATIATALGGSLAALALPIRLASGVETLQAEFEVLTGNIKTATSAIAEVKKFAGTTPYGLEGLAQTTKLLLNYGISAGQATDDIKRLAEVAGGSQEKLDRLALAFGQIASKGRLMGQEALQLTESGFSPLQTLAEMTGQSVSELSDKMSKGAISFAQVRSALVEVTSAGGRFGGLMARMADTTAGRWAALKEEFFEVARSLGELLMPTVREWIATARDVLKSVSAWVKDNETLAKVIAGVVTVLGTMTAGLVVLRAGLAAASTVTGVFSYGLTAAGVVMARMAQNMGVVAAAATASATETATGVDAAMTQTVVAVGTANNALGRLRSTFSRVGTAAGRSMARLEQRIGAAVGAIDASVSQMLTAVGGLSAMGPSVDATTALVTAALTRLDGAFEVAALGMSAAVGEMLAANQLLGGLTGGSIVSPLAGAAEQSAVDAASIVDDIATTGRAQDQAENNRGRRPRRRLRMPDVFSRTVEIPQQRVMVDVIPKFATAGFEHTHDSLMVLQTQAARTGNVFNSMFRLLGSGISRVTVLIGGSTLAMTALIVAGVASFGVLLHRIGYLVPLVNRVKAAFTNVANVVSQAVGGISDALAVGDWSEAINIAWLGMKLSFLKALRSMTGEGGNVLIQFTNFVIDYAQGIVDALVDMAKAIPGLIIAAVTGFGDAKQLGNDILATFTDALVGNGDVIKGFTAETEKESNAAIERVASKRKKLDGKLDETKVPGERKPSDQERFAANIGKGVDPRAASLPDATISDANAAAEERMKSLREEIDELRVGKSAFDQHKLALSGVTDANRRSIAALEAQRIAIEATNSAKDKIKSIQDEILGIKFGSENVERYKLAQQGANQATLAHLATLERQKLFLESMTSAKNEITEALLGAEAATKLRLAQQGLTGQQIKSITAMNALAKRMGDARSMADQIKERFKTPLQAYEETAQKIRDAQLAGLISQELSAKAYADAMQEMQSRTDELNAKANEGPAFVSSFDERRNFFKAIEEQARQVQATIDGQQLASLNARDAANVLLGGKGGEKLSESERLQIALMKEQNETLINIDRNLSQPKILVSIP